MKKYVPKSSVVFFALVMAFIATTSVSWAAGYQYNLSCSGCHGNPPLDDSTRNPVTGGFVGNHQTHTGANKCDVCHAGTTNPSAFTAAHSDGKIQMFSKYAKGTFVNQTSVFNPTNATCSNVNCHFEKTTPDSWGRAVLVKPVAPNLVTGGDCNYCHNSPPSYAPQKASGTGHASHTVDTQFAGVNNCSLCHVDNYNVAQPFQHATSAGRALGMNTAIRYTGPVTDYLPSQTNVLGKCSNTYCHSNGSPTPATQGYTTVAYRAYSTPVFGTTGAGCGICHAASPTTNAHNRHVSQIGYACVLCHADTVDATNNIIHANGTHVNNVHNYSFSGIAGTGSNCSTSLCHAVGGVAPTTAPVWTAQNSAVCGSCHKADNTSLATFAHPAHLNNAVAKYGPTALQGTAAAGSCQACHTSYPSNHGNGTVEAPLTTCNPCHVGTLSVAIWKGGRVTCESCHVGTTRSVIQGVTAPDQNLAATKGHNQATFTGAPQCTTCHDNTTTHISGVLGDNARLPATQPNDNTQCASCHNNAAKVKVQFRNMSTHFTTYGGAQNMLCKNCHDPHGTTNLSMIRTQLKGTWTNATTYTITYTNAVSGFVAANNRGLCQVCHTKTKYWLAGKPELNHPTSGCLDCHSHNAKGGAFKPSGSCDGCHGYPPVPKGLAGLTFGTAGNYANARFEDYTGGGGAHAIPAHVKAAAVASEGWSNCAMCHNGGNLVTIANHKTLMPIKANIGNVTVSLDQKLKFNNTLQAVYSSERLVYPGNKTGTCNNTECHFKPSPRWSIVR